MPGEPAMLMSSETTPASTAVQSLIQEEVEFLMYEAGVDRTFISMWETDRRQPTLSVIFALAVVLNQRPEEIIAATQKLSQLPH